MQDPVFQANMKKMAQGAQFQQSIKRIKMAELQKKSRTKKSKGSLKETNGGKEGC